MHNTIEANAIKAIQRYIWENIAIEKVLRNEMQCNVSADLLQHSLQDNPHDLIFGDDSDIAQKMKADEEFVSKIKSLVNKKENCQEILSSDKCHNFNKGDLYYSIHSCNFDIDEIIPSANGKKDVIVHIKDEYDYTEIQSFVEKYKEDDTWKKRFDLDSVSLGTIANDAAFISSYLGAINPYSIDIYLRIRM